MRKIPKLFQFDRDTHRVLPVVNPGCEWVLAGEGVPTRKWDGTAILVKPDYSLWKRYDAKPGRIPPSGFEPAQEPDAITGHYPGWIPTSAGDPADRWLHEAWLALTEGQQVMPSPGTYELCGPKVNGNPEHRVTHVLLRHGAEVLGEIGNRSFESLREWFKLADIEGVVWHHPDGRMAKLTLKDFGFKRPAC